MKVRTSFGSGRTDKRTRRLVEACPRVGVYQLHHSGSLVSGTSTQWRVVNHVVTVRAERTRVMLAVDGQDEVPVMLDREVRHLGGEQVFFQCPGCGARRHHLYVQGPHLLCRRCARLTYRSRYECWSPALRHAGNLRRRLGGYLFGPPPPKPRFVRWEYYNQWIAELGACEAMATAVLGATVAALEKRRKGVCNAES
jgi:hypothetical protein